MKKSGGPEKIMMYSVNRKLEYSGFDEDYSNWFYSHDHTTLKIGMAWPGYKAGLPKQVEKIKQEFQKLFNHGTSENGLIQSTLFSNENLVLRKTMKHFDQDGEVTDITFLLSKPSGTEERTIYSESDVMNLDLVARNVQNSVVITNHLKEVEYVNPAFEKLTGYQKHEVLGKKLSFLQGEKTNLADVRKLNSALKKQVSFSIELLNYHKSGTPYWIEIFVTPIFDNQGNLSKYIGIQNDITERKKKDEISSKNEAQYLSIINALHEGLVVQDMTDKIVLANDSAAKILGLTKDQLLGKDSYDPRWKALNMDGSPLSAKQHPSMITLRTGKPVTNFLMSVQVGEDFRRIISINSEPVRDTNNKLFGVVASFLDVTHQIDTREELKESEERYRLLVENATVGILLHMDGKIKIRNSFAARLLEEEPKGALINKPFLEIIHPDFQEIVKNRYYRLEKNKTQRLEALEEQLITFKGKTLDVLKSGILVNYQGKPAFLTVFSDISKIKESEQLIRLNQERISNLANSIPGALLQYKINPDGTDELPYVSDQVSELWEISKEEALKDVSKLWEPVLQDDLQDMKESIVESMEKMTFWDHKWRIQTKSGKTKWLNGRGVPKKMEDGSCFWDTLILDITEQKVTDNRLLEINQQLELAVDTARLGIWTYDMVLDRLEWNDVLLGIYNISREEFNNKVVDWTSKLHEEDAQQAFLEFEKIVKGKTVENKRFRIRPTPDTIKYIQASGAPIYDKEGKVIKLIGINVDISDFVEKEEKLEQTLDAKNTLLKELHHRIKNNLNLITNLMYFKSRNTEDQGVLDYIMETKTRINTIARTHDQLLKMEEFDQLDVKRYLEDLITSLVRTYTISGSEYPTTLEIQSVRLSVDKILMLGLLTNEIILNTIKHAYQPDTGGPIFLSLTRDGELIQLTIFDRGKGMKEKNPGGKNSTGIDLITLLVKQLKGNIKQEISEGVKYIINFPISNRP